MLSTLARRRPRRLAAAWYGAVALIPSVLFGLPLLLATASDGSRLDAAAVHALVTVWVLPASAAAVAGLAAGTAASRSAVGALLRGASVAVFATLVVGYVPLLFEPPPGPGSEFTAAQQAERSQALGHAFVLVLCVPMALLGSLAGWLLRVVTRRAVGTAGEPE